MGILLLILGLLVSALFGVVTPYSAVRAPAAPSWTAAHPAASSGSTTASVRPSSHRTPGGDGHALESAWVEKEENPQKDTSHEKATGLSFAAAAGDLDAAAARAVTPPRPPAPTVLLC